MLITSQHDRAHVAARANIAAQNQLIRSLREFRLTAGVTVEDVARQCGTSGQIIEDIESGDWEMNLTELRHYANSVGAVVSFYVEGAEVATRAHESY